MKKENAIEEVVSLRPQLKSLARADSVESYLDAALDWNPSGFRHRGKLISLLLEEFCRAYDLDDVGRKSLEQQLNSSWSVQTGEHISIPRIRGRATAKVMADGLVLPFHNSMVFQGVVYWAAMNHARGYRYSLEMATGRVPLNNPLSGAYLEISPQAKLIRLAAEKWHGTPQLLIPAIGEENIFKIRRDLRQSKHLVSADLSVFWEELIDQLGRDHGSFVDQIAFSHSLIMSKTMPIRQLTIESERVAADFLAMLLADPDSLVGHIFSHADILSNFLERFSGINTGWERGRTPFLEVVSSGSVPHLAEYEGCLEPEVLASRLRQRTIYPKGVMKFFAFMVDGGLLSVGGQQQIVYNGEVRDRAVGFLDYLGEMSSSLALKEMPLDVAVITPCWGVKEKDRELVSVLDCLDFPLTAADMERMLGLSGFDSLGNALPILYPFLANKAMQQIDTN
jgi:hypothetical protein